MDSKLKLQNDSPSISSTLSESSNGKNIQSFFLKNSNQITIEILNFGGIVKSIKTPDKSGKIDDIVLGFDQPADYLKDHPFFGAIIGRYANRIANGKFTLDDKEYKLEKNHGQNSLHGGNNAFDKQIWNSESSISSNSVTLKLHLHSPHMHEGFPGNLEISTLYTLNNNNEFIIEYNATVDRPTVINLTNHSYFNLLGTTEKTIENHIVEIHANEFTPVDEHQIPTGKIELVKDTPFDFSDPKRIGADIEIKNNQLEIGNGYDHNYVLNNNSKLVHAVTVIEPETGRKLEVLTTEPGVQFYSGNWLDAISGKNNITYKKHHGFCFETQHYPDSPNHPNFPSTRLNKDDKFYSKTVYKFSTI